MRGYIHLYTGNGKGKTTAALGLALRAAGAGMRILFAQFVKGQEYSELKAIRNSLPQITVRQYGLDCFIINRPTQNDIDAARKGFEEVSEAVLSGEYDLIVMDEAAIAIYYNLFAVEELIELLKRKPVETEIVITGRYAPPELIGFADLVTEMKEVRHYYSEGVKARRGIEH